MKIIGLFKFSVDILFAIAIFYFKRQPQRILPRDPQENAFFRQVTDSIPQKWTGAMRINFPMFQNRKEAGEYLNNLRAQGKQRDYYWTAPGEDQRNER